MQWVSGTMDMTFSGVPQMHEFWCGFSEISIGLENTRDLRWWWKWGLSSLFPEGPSRHKVLGRRFKWKSRNAIFTELAKDAGSSAASRGLLRKRDVEKVTLKHHLRYSISFQKTQTLLKERRKKLYNGPSLTSWHPSLKCLGMTSEKHV